jgi:hypothetical protein
MNRIGKEITGLWRFWSVRFDLIMYSAMGYFIANPGEVGKLIALLPDRWRPVAAVMVPALLFAARSGTGAAARHKFAAEVKGDD